MMVLTAKVDKKKIALILAGILALIIGLVALLSGGEDTPVAATATSVSGNEDRLNFLRGFGWDVTTSPRESGQVRIPKEDNPVFERYNTLQKSQGYDLTPYAGQTVMRYVYQVNNYPNATDPVYATLLISKNQIIGGDVTDTAAKGKMQGFQMNKTLPEADATVPTEESTTPTEESTAPTEKPAS